MRALFLSTDYLDLITRGSDFPSGVQPEQDFQTAVPLKRLPFGNTALENYQNALCSIWSAIKIHLMNSCKMLKAGPAEK